MKAHKSQSSLMFITTIIIHVLYLYPHGNISERRLLESHATFTLH